MKIILAPAKNMEDVLDYKWNNYPYFLNRTKKIKDALKDLDYEEYKKILKVNDSIGLKGYENLNKENLNISPAIYAYTGLAYKYLDVKSLKEEDIEYLENNLFILSAYYGVLRPLDGINTYRLEMANKLKIGKTKDLYEFWGGSLYDFVTTKDKVIINLASKEYAKCIETYLEDDVRYIDVVFADLENGRVISKGAISKMARGAMLRYLAINKIDDIEKIKDFKDLNFRFDEDKSKENLFVFIRN